MLALINISFFSLLTSCDFLLGPLQEKLLFYGSAGPFFAGNEVLFFFAFQSKIIKVLVKTTHNHSCLFQVHKAPIRWLKAAIILGIPGHFLLNLFHRSISLVFVGSW